MTVDEANTVIGLISILPFENIDGRTTRLIRERQFTEFANLVKSLVHEPIQEDPNKG